MANLRSGKSDQLPPADEKYLFGSDAELANRAGATGYPAGKDPEENAPSFKQIGPATGRQSVNDVTTGEHKSGDFKFSGGVS